MANLPIIREEVRNPEYLTHGPWNNYCCGKADCPCAEQAINWADIPTLPMTQRTWAEATKWLSEDDELDETGTHPPDCRCAWCEPQERNATQQCSDGSWW